MAVWAGAVRRGAAQHARPHIPLFLVPSSPHSDLVATDEGLSDVSERGGASGRFGDYFCLYIANFTRRLWLCANFKQRANQP